MLQWCRSSNGQTPLRAGVPHRPATAATGECLLHSISDGSGSSQGKVCREAWTRLLVLVA